VGWVFTERLPVRGIKSVRATRAVKKLAVALPEGVVPAIGDTLTPVKTPRATKRPLVKATAVVKAPAAVKAVKKAASAEAKEAKEPKEPKEAKEAKEAKDQSVVATARRSKKSVAPVKKVAIKKATARSLEHDPTPVEAPASAPAVALRRGRQPVNPERGFSAFVKQFKVGATLSGEVVAFTSHGAVIQVLVTNADAIECYAPTTSLGDPAPARARDVLKRGDHRTFRLVNVDGDRRIAELALS
jgi:hypothetical protein